VTKSYCTASPSNSSYFTPPNNCVEVSCNSDQVANPNCKCAYPYKGTIFWGLASFDLGNSSYYAELAKSLMKTLQSSSLPVDSVSLSNPTMDSSGNIELSLEVFPSCQECFNQIAITMVGFALTFCLSTRHQILDPSILWLIHMRIVQQVTLNWKVIVIM